MRRMATMIASLTAALLLALAPAYAASNNYYAQTLVIFNVPSDATFSIAMPANYGTWTSITSSSDYPSATATDWISFNFTGTTQTTLQEPYQLGDSGDKQDGAASPIFYIDNTGNTNEQFDIKLNQTEPTGIQLHFNGSCVGTCGTVQTGIKQATTSYAQIASAVTTSSYLNVTLYANVSGGTSGTTLRYLAIKSTAVA